MWQGLTVALDTADIVRRIAYIRFLHHLGVEQARLPEPMCSASVLMFHDAAESFLLMAAEHLRAPSIYEFEKYWEALKPQKLAGGVDLPVQQGMKRLNGARKQVKHHGGHPSPATIELIKNDTATFLAAATQIVFGIDYDAASMASVIPQAPVRDLAMKADVANSSGDHIGAMVHLADAWAELLFPEARGYDDDGPSPFRFGPTIRRTLPEYEIAAYLRNEKLQYRNPRRNDDIARQITEVTEVARELQTAARLTAVGIDFAAYQRFQALTPHRDDYATGRRVYYAPAGYAPTVDDVASCLQFLVTAALRLASAEAQLAHPPWVDGAQGWRTQWVPVREVPGGGD